MDHVALVVNPVGRVPRRSTTTSPTQTHQQAAPSGRIHTRTQLLHLNAKHRIFFVLLPLLFFVQRASALTLAWDAVTNTTIGGYNLYVGTVTRSYTTTNDVGNVTQFSISNLVVGTTYFFALSAYDTYGIESDLSAELAYTVTTSTSTPPVVLLTSPVDGTVYTNPTTIRLSATVTANGHTLTKVQFYNSAAIIGQDSTSPYRMNWSNGIPGTFNIRARLLYDTNLTIDSLVATVSFLGPAASVHLEAPQFLPTGFQTFITWNVGQSYRIQRSTNLLDWTDVLSRTALETNFLFVDPGAALNPKSFYRVASP